MRDLATVDIDDEDLAAKPAANGDNLIPRGEEEGIIERIAEHMAAVMRELNLDLDDENYAQTPERVAKMYLEMFHGLREGVAPKITTFPNDEGYHHMVIEKTTSFRSTGTHT
jgi:GTP cyclohydrolase I